MSTEVRQYPYRPDGTAQDGALPYLPLKLGLNQRWVETVALLDSGASVNVIPYSLGIQLGADWSEQGQEITLGGNLSTAPAKGIVLDAVVDSFEPVRLVFAWSQLDSAPVILGQVNFFQKFRVSFTGAEQTFDLSLYRTD